MISSYSYFIFLLLILLLVIYFICCFVRQGIIILNRRVFITKLDLVEFLRTLKSHNLNYLKIVILIKTKPIYIMIVFGYSPSKML